MTSAICPYCSAILAKVPQRKTKCPHCSKAIFVKRPFGEPRGTKVLMTEQRAIDEEAKWLSDGEMKEWQSKLASIGISEEQFTNEHSRLGAKDNGLTAARHIVYAVLSAEKDLHRLKMAAGLMVQIVRKQGGDPLEYMRESYRFELERLRPRGRAVVIRKPQPWPPAKFMNELHEAGEDISSIAKKTGYSIQTVEMALKTKGADKRAGSQCDRWAGKEFSIDEALAEMPLPCGGECVCWYKSVF